MEPKDLLHPEDAEMQTQVVTAGASDEAQPIAEIEHPQSSEIVEPEIVELETVEPETVEPETVEPEIVEPEIVEPEIVEPEIVEPEIVEPEIVEPEIVEPENSDLAPCTLEPCTLAPCTLEPEQSFTEMLTEIEEEQEEITEEEQEEIEVEIEKIPESIEEIEKEYSLLSFEEMVEKIQDVVSEENFNEMKLRFGFLKTSIITHIKELKNKALELFVAEGGNKEEFEHQPSELEKKFDGALKKYRDCKAKFIENLELAKQQNLEAKQQIIQGLKELVENESNLKVLNDRFKEFQEKWREIGPVPQNESSNLWQHYHFYVEKFFDILRINKELRTLDLKKNLEQKLKLCEQAEELLLQDTINKSFKELQRLHDEWREVGPVLEEKKEEIWERFKNASDQLNQRRREHYDSLLGEQQNNYNAKVVLCEQAEELISKETKTLKENNLVSDKLAELLKMWKTLGAAPGKLNEEIWQRFKKSLDKFFTDKKDYYQQLKNEQLQNFNIKLNLAIQAEALALRNDWKKATDEIIILQNEWKKIGATSRKNSEVVWKRFRTACDGFFAAKSNYFNNAQTIEAENLRLKEELIKRIEEYVFTDNRDENFEALKAFQREFTELGHVPRKEKDTIYAKFRDAVNKRFQDLKMSIDDVKKSNYKSKIDTILNNPNADQILDKERRFLSNKLQQLKDDIALWENNLGFFANSKNADLLKEEFSKKIDSAKEEAKELAYKLKMMVQKN